jgi:hypothetical protein
LGVALQSDALNRLRAQAVRCRELAETATDPEVAEALRDMARDIEIALPVIESELALAKAKSAPSDR